MFLIASSSAVAWRDNSPNSVDEMSRNAMQQSYQQEMIRQQNMQMQLNQQHQYYMQQRQQQQMQDDMSRRHQYQNFNPWLNNRGH